MSNIILYTTHCPKCKIIEKKLADNNITYKEITDVDIMISLGFTTTPILEVDGVYMNFKDANEWINNYKQED